MYVCNDGHLGQNIKPSGFPGLRKEIKQAQANLVFLNDDRAPRGLLIVCKR